MPSFLTPREVQERNDEHTVWQWMDDFTVLTLFRGELMARCSEDNVCAGPCDEYCHELVVHGEGFVLEVYDRAEKAIIFEIPSEQLRSLALAFMKEES